MPLLGHSVTNQFTKPLAKILLAAFDRSSKPLTWSSRENREKTGFFEETLKKNQSGNDFKNIKNTIRCAVLF